MSHVFLNAAINTSGSEVFGNVWKTKTRPSSRPAYLGNKKITGLTSITPKITCNFSSGTYPYCLAVSGEQTTCDAGDAWQDLHYEWDFGDSGSTEWIRDHYTGLPMNTNDEQVSPAAAHVYRSDGSYTVTLTVSGINEYGQTVSASTTTVLRLGEYEVFMGGATGGTFTLTVDGQTTSAIAYDATMATIVSNLAGLSTVGSGNVRDTGYGKYQFVGSLAGQTITHTADFTSLTGAGAGDAAPQLIERFAASSNASVTVSDRTGWTVRYFDTNATSHGDGLTESTPWNNATTAYEYMHTSFTSGDNKVLKIARGSVWELDNRLKLENASGRIIEPYGTGAKPVIKNDTGTATSYEIMDVEVPYWSGLTMSNVKFIDVAVRGAQTGKLACIIVGQSNNGTTTHPRANFHDFLAIGVDFDRVAGADAQFLRANGTETIHSMFAWRCAFRVGAYDILAAYNPELASWCGDIGSVYSGIDGSLNLDHHIYPKYHSDGIWHFITFGRAISANYCVNLTSTGDGACPRHSFDGCDITGTQNGLDASNVNNNYSGGDTSYIDKMRVQCCLIHSGGIGTQENAMAAWNVKDLLIAFCDMWDNPDRNVVIADDTNGNVTLRCNNSYGESPLIDVQHPDCTLWGNSAYSTSSDSNPAFMWNSTESTIGDWDVDYNTWYSPSETESFYDRDTTTFVSFATWQGTHGHDLNGAEEDPGFSDPTNGYMQYSWPTPEYEASSVTPKAGSANDAASLAAYIQQYGIPAPQLDITPQHPGVVIDTSGISQPGILPNG